MQLLDGCHLVASGYLGFGLSDPWDAHGYLLCSRGEAILIDTGSGRDTAALVDRIDQALGDDTRLVAISLTHAHVDHSGGAAELAQHYGVPVRASAVAAGWLGRGDETAVGLPEARRQGVYPADQILRAVPGVTPVDDDPELPIGDLLVRAIPATGHSADHTVYSVQLPTGSALFTGDLVFAQGRVAVLDTTDTDPQALEVSIRAAAALHPDHLFPGHGAVALSRGWAHLDAAVASFDRGARPAGLVA
ncbi:MBL fold metallo-hydrolase [Herbiconiux wuyangfengii]|uniref:MBL fold metallo-hydrolase n=1 Tax=Herbiconiux wuyangfengii TaxID=3342794 RepID=UPI0035BC0B32